MNRRLACRAVVATVFVAALGLASPATAAAAPVAPGFASVADATIAPGALMITPFDQSTVTACTANFVFSGGGGTYLGYAAHCAGASGAMGLSGCENPTLPLGTTVMVEGKDGVRISTTLAYSSWTTMQERGETDEALCLFNDFALVKLDPGDVDKVDPSVPELGGPTGLDTNGTQNGEPVFSYQPNDGRAAVKEGSSLGDTDGGLTHQVRTVPPGRPGDSGGGYLDGEGTAFGVLSTRFVDGTNGVTDLARALSYANRYGDVSSVTLVRGTEPFASPSGQAPSEFPELEFPELIP